MNMQNYLGFLTELNQALDTLTALEQRKLKAVQNNDLQTLDQCMKQEQALLLKLRGIDKKRESIQKDLGFENLTFTQIIEKAPLSHKKQLSEIFDTLNLKLDRYKDIFTNTQNAIEINLHNINKKLESFDVADKLNKTYKEDGEVVTMKRSFTSRRV